jgi:hypothetical protein
MLRINGIRLNMLTNDEACKAEEDKLKIVHHIVKFKKSKNQLGRYLQEPHSTELTRGPPELVQHFYL